MSIKTPIVDAHRLQKVYLTDQLETHAVCSVDLQIERGEFLAVTGPSGCGKSTLLALLGMMEQPTAGMLRIDETDVTQLNLKQLARHRSRSVGFVFQEFNLIGDLNVLDNVALPLLYSGINKLERRQRAAEVLERIGMTGRAQHYPKQLSGGQQQRVAIARAIVSKPPLLLADEPTGNLDSQNGAAVMELLCEYHAAGGTIGLVTHEVSHVKFADRHITMADGRFASEQRRGLPMLGGKGTDDGARS